MAPKNCENHLSLTLAPCRSKLVRRTYRTLQILGRRLGCTYLLGIYWANKLRRSAIYDELAIFTPIGHSLVFFEAGEAVDHLQSQYIYLLCLST